MRTNNGGQNWSWIGIPTSSRIMDILFLNESFGWACGASGKIIRTTNYGLDWSLANSNVNVELRDIQFLNQLQGWSVGLNGAILHSLDGGANWYQEISGTNNNLYGVHFADSLIGYVVGDNGIILKTNNGGIPVELISFSVKQEQNRILLNWITGTETNNSGFEIERNFNETDWSSIGFLPGQETTTEKQVYEFSDRPDIAGTYHYRLKQIDFDGSYDYSNELSVDFKPQFSFSLEQNYPNPFNPSTLIHYSIPQEGIITLTVYNSLGQTVKVLVNEVKEAGNHDVVFNASTLSSGVCYYTLSWGNQIQTKKLLYIKE